MDLLVVVHIYQGFPEDVWVTDKEEIAEAWRAESDARHGITRDEDGEPPSEGEHQVFVLNCHRHNIG